MNQWYDETLVAIFANVNNKFEVWELPARQLCTVSKRGRIFRTEERAEQFITEQFPDSVLRVTDDDILEEMKRREQAAKQSLQ
jgi:hypothetical protein